MLFPVIGVQIHILVQHIKLVNQWVALGHRCHILFHFFLEFGRCQRFYPGWILASPCQGMISKTHMIGQGMIIGYVGLAPVHNIPGGFH